MIRYTEDHEWINLDGDTGTVGISPTPLNSLATLSLSNCPRLAAKSPRAMRLLCLSR